MDDTGGVNMLELGKPIQACPACGAVEDVECWPETKDYWENHEEDPQVRCGKCGVRGPEKPTEDEAIDAWNAMPRHNLFDQLVAEFNCNTAEGMYYLLKAANEIRGSNNERGRQEHC